MKVNPEVAKRYIIYREWRNTERQKEEHTQEVARWHSYHRPKRHQPQRQHEGDHTPAGQMMTFASEVSKDYTYRYILPTKFAEAHRRGGIPYPRPEFSPPRPLLAFSTISPISTSVDSTPKMGIRTPQSIQSCIHWQPLSSDNQNEQHGGQAIPAFDFFMAAWCVQNFCGNTSADLLTLGLLRIRMCLQSSRQKRCEKSSRAHHFHPPSEEQKKSLTDELTDIAHWPCTHDRLSFILQNTRADTP